MNHAPVSPLVAFIWHMKLSHISSPPAWVKKVGIVAVWCCMLVPAWAQLGPERKAVNALEDGKWSIARQNLRKVLAKDSTATEAHYWMSKFFTASGNPDANLDSAYRSINLSLQTFLTSTPRQRERLARIPLDSAIIISRREVIDSMAFEQARRLHSEQAYQRFIDSFTFARQKTEALELRNEVAFLEALRLNTTQSYQNYLNKYPQSLRTKEAHQRYEQLLLQEYTRDGKLSSYRKLIQDHPETIFRTQVEARIFEIATAGGSREHFMQYLDACTNCPFRNRALSILYYINRESGRPLPASYVTDSLKRLDRLKEGYLVPFLKNGLFGFMDEEGRDVLEPRFHDIDEDDRCGNLQRDFFITSDGLFARSGIRLFTSPVEEVTDLGFGFMKVRLKAGIRVVSKSGFQITENEVEDVRLIARRYLALRQNDLWGLVAFNGLSLLPYQYQDISFIDNIAVLQRTGKKILVKLESIAAVADQNPLDESLVFDEVKAWGSGDLWVRNGILEGVLNQKLEFVIPFDRHRLTKNTFGFIQEKENKLRLKGIGNQLEAEAFDRIKDYGNWVELQQTSRISLFHVPSAKIVEQDLDSVWVKNQMVFARKRDSLLLFGKQGVLATFNKLSPIHFMNSRDSSVFFFVQDRVRKTVFEATTGQKYFAIEADEIEHLGAGFFLASKAKKKGLLSKDGKWLLPPQYDAIVLSTNGFVSLYRDKKFGLYDLATRKLIKPVYERNLFPYSSQLFVAFREGFYGLLAPDEKPVTPFEFDEIKFWNDTSALVKKNFHWAIYDLRKHQIILDKIKQFEILVSGEETILKIQRENYYGVISNQKGIIIPANFTDVFNVGSAEKPLYFTEKRVEEADIYVVIYYDRAGKFLRKQVYESEEYDRIVCEDN